MFLVVKDDYTETCDRRRYRSIQNLRVSFALNCAFCPGLALLSFWSDLSLYVSDVDTPWQVQLVQGKCHAIFPAF